MSIAELEKLTLTYNPGSDNLEYTMYPVSEVDEDQQKPAFSVSPPGVSARDNVLLGIQGQTADIPIEFVIYDDGTDRANGTYSSTVVTVGEQINYLRDEMHAPTFSAEWTLDHDTGGQFSTQIYENDSVYLERLNLPTLSESDRAWKRARMRLRRGGTA